jgi:hypothetical protein
MEYGCHQVLVVRDAVVVEAVGEYKAIESALA